MLNASVPANATTLSAASPYNRRAIMRAAHWSAKWRASAFGNRKPYRELFAEALAHEWKKAKHKAP